MKLPPWLETAGYVVCWVISLAITLLFVVLLFIAQSCVPGG